ncbi:MAG TPA: Fur family transcriptional regulator [Mycobacterium sp.]|nr:Fur family transcriptional regulator [Mycobacterium sp.]
MATHAHRQVAATTETTDSSAAADAVRQVLRSDGGRVTTARVLVLQILADAGEHLSAQQIHQRVSAAAPSLNVSTVYRTLTRLEELELIHALPTPGETLYGIADQPHHHAICTECGKVTELGGEPLTDTLEALERITGYTFAASSSLTIRAVCRACQTKTRRPRKR